jgi:hypothetical protein
VNALTFILPAIIGGFVIALLFKYRKKLTLKYFFGGALFFAGIFITFFFGDSILFLLQSRFYNLFILNYDAFNINGFSYTTLIAFNEIYIVMIISCGVISFLITYVITSKKFSTKMKNFALIFQSALMGAFLSVILPTYTVVILLIGLSIYDIYSVRRGPIKDIVRYTLEEETENMRAALNQHETKNSEFIARSKSPHIFRINQTSKEPSNNNSSQNSTYHTNQNLLSGAGNGSETTISDSTLSKEKVNNNKIPKQVIYKAYESKDNYDDTDSILNSMTYSSRDWDIGIGDLVFYSLLASQPLTPYFIFNHGAHLLNSYGIWIFWLISLFTIIGILIGFVITIRLLERNSMLPGLPFSMALGLVGFLSSTLILSYI